MEGDYVVPAGADLCVAFLVDDGDQTDDPHDSLSIECVYSNMQVEFVLERLPGWDFSEGTTYIASCLVSSMPRMDCPGLE